MTTPRSNIVKLRLTDLEKQDWQEAAGGARKLSAWVRSVCNDAAEADRQSNANPGLLPDEDGYVPNVKPKIVADAIERDVERTPEPQPRQAVPTEQTSAQCPRWMHHRPGVYCGSCKQVVKK